MLPKEVFELSVLNKFFRVSLFDDANTVKLAVLKPARIAMTFMATPLKLSIILKSSVLEFINTPRITNRNIDKKAGKSQSVFVSFGEEYLK
ncbi:hypothetical protein GCM10011389_10730 [Pontibacillus salipaludis]|uniref:Uncharacterized protein n=1 Tax=Pontibacillus salipaludis TaxID=1697394 RepID=A0ABQ1PW10_9BACI|nr:hypothetical protein GCM10011389_10730 [Pontibacillus salipaludis]